MEVLWSVLSLGDAHQEGGKFDQSSHGLCFRQNFWHSGKDLFMKVS